MLEPTLQPGTWTMQAEQIDRNLQHLDYLLSTGTNLYAIKQHANQIIGHLERLTFQIDKNTSLDEGDNKEKWEIFRYLFDTFRKLQEKIDKKISQQQLTNRGSPVVIDIGEFQENAELQSLSRLQLAMKNVKDTFNQQKENIGEINCVASAKPSLLIKIGIGVFGVFVVGILFFI